MSVGSIDRELIYLDHAATTPMRAEAIAAMQPYLADVYANPSGSHRFAREARRAIDEARDSVAAVLGCKPGEVVFNGGGTEGDNTAIFGAVRSVQAGGGSATAVCGAAEHHAVLHCVEHLAPSGAGMVVGTDALGCIDTSALTELLGRLSGTGTVPAVSVMAVNNEVGSITPLEDVAKVVRAAAPGAVLHTDAVQAACWLDLAPLTACVDVLTLSSHKFGGPKGCGVMFQRSGVDIEPLIFGGGQERDRRSGTHNVAGIVATAAALTATVAERDAESARIAALRNELIAGLVAIGGVHVTVPVDRSVPGIAHVCIEGIENEALLFLLDEAGVCASAASACASGAMEPSHVLAAMGVPRELARGALRLSLGHTTTKSDIVAAIGIIGTAVARLRAHNRA
jgi:cysteine desulfurase